MATAGPLRSDTAPGPAEAGEDASGVLAAIVTGDERAIANLPGNVGATRLARYAALAAANGQLRVLQLLHARGADVLAEDQLGLRLSVASGWVEVFDYLVEEGGTPLRFEAELVRSAARSGRVPMLERLGALKCDLAYCAELFDEIVSAPSLVAVRSYLNPSFPTLEPLARLVDAIRSSSLEAVRAAFPNTDYGAHARVLLETAARTGSVGIFRFLCESGVDLTLEKARVLEAAAEKGHYDLLELLVTKYGCDPGTAPEAAALAAANGHIECLTLLWTSGAARNVLPQVTLKLSALNGHDETHDYLTDAGGIDALAEDRRAIKAMLDEIAVAPEVYRPSRFWSFFNEVNLEQLRRFGMHRFKRCVNQNYFNYVPLGITDPQLVGLIGYFLRSFLRHPPLRGDLLARMDDPDRYGGNGAPVTADRRVFRSWSDTAKLASAGRWMQRLLYRLLVGLLWRYALRHDAAQVSRGMQEPALGSPILTTVNDRFVSQDLAHSVIECNVILQGLSELPPGDPVLIAEVGAGYGRVGDVLLSKGRCRYFVFDIPPSLYVAQWYLSRRHPFKRVFPFRHLERLEDAQGELNQVDIAFFTPNQLELFPDGYFDVVINISSLHEMRREQMRHILSHLYRIASQRVYLKQYRHYRNPRDEIEISESDYWVPDGWEKRLWRRDPVDRRFFEALLMRQDLPPGPGGSARRGSFGSIKARRPTISILLANYNDAPYLRTSLEGILSQTDPADEVIVVDDGSTDGSVELLRQSVTRHPNARLVCQGRNRGQHAAIQRALIEARSDYVVWAASDDLLLPQFVERSRRALAEHPGCGICFSRLCAWREGGREVNEYTERNHGAAFDLGTAPRYYSPDELRAILRGHYLWISGNTVLARRDLLLQIGGFHSTLRWHADWFSFYVIALRWGACSVPETLAMMRERANTYSRAGMQDAAEQERVLCALLDTLKSPSYRDLLPVFRECPSLLSPFGRRIVYAAMRRPRHWDLALSTGLWFAKRRLQRLG